jgi:hypothetical protein
MNKYENGSILLNGLNISWNLVDENSFFAGLKEPVEEFFFWIENPKTKIRERFSFRNSVMERVISEKIKEQGAYSWTENLKELQFFISRRFLWGGYDKKECNSWVKLKRERVNNLLYGFLNCIMSDYSAGCCAFSDFCADFGYSDDSRNAEKVYNALVENSDKITKVFAGLSDKQKSFFFEDVAEETEKFSKELNKAIKKELV